MATFTVSASGVTNIDSLVGKQGNDTYNIAGSTTSTLLIDQDSRFGAGTSPWSGAMNAISGSVTLGGSLAIEGRYVRIIPYNTGTGSVPPPGVTITQGSASGVLIGVYSALNVSPEAVGATMPASGFIKIKAWNDVPFTATTVTIPATTGSNLVPANVSGMEGTLAVTDFTITAGAGAVANSSTFAQAGTKSLRIAPSSTTTIVTKMASGTRFPIGAGLAVTVSGYIRGSDVKSCTLDIEWFDSTNTSISTTLIQTQNCATGAWTQYTAGAVTAPANTRWASINVTVTTPTSGGFYYVDSLTATPGNWTTGATATGADRAGWIGVVGVEGVNHTLTAAGQTYYSDGSFCKGSWYEVGTTDGTRATTYQIPTNGGLSYHGGVLVDKSVATNITAASWSGGVATFTSASHGLTTGDRVFIGGVLPRTYTSDINNIEACTVLTANTFSIPMTTNPGTYTSGGTVAPVEWFPTTTNLNTTIRTERVPGSVCWVDSATGLLRFGNHNVTSTGGYCPATGLKIRIPNVITSAVASGYATPLTNTLNAVFGSRVRFYAGTTAGRTVLSQMAGVWSPSVIQSGSYGQMNDCAVIGTISFSSETLSSSITFNCVGGNAASTITNGITINTHGAGVTIKDNTISIGDTTTTKKGISISNTNGATITGNKIMGTGNRTSTAIYAFDFSVGDTATISNNTIVNCGGVITTSQFKNGTMTSTRYWGSGAGYVPIANSMGMYLIQNVSTGWTFDGLTVDQPAPFNVMRGGFISTASSSDNCVFRNMGTYASPINAGTDVAYNKAFSRTTTTATITHTAHGLRNGETIYVIASTDTTTSPYSSARTAIVVGIKTITYIDANTFSFTCLNAGTATGTIDYFACGFAAVASFTTASRNLTIQNIHLLGISLTPLNGSPVSDNVRIENCTLGWRLNGNNATLPRQNNTQKFSSCYYQPYEYSIAAPSTVGVHFSDYWVRPTTTPGVDTVASATWTRSGTLATVTETDHGLQDNMRIYVENSSNQAAIPSGVKELTVVVVNKDIFTITCTNSGTTSGTLDYRLPGDGNILITPDATSASTTPYVTLSGTATFTGNGTLYAPTVNDQVVWEQSEYMLGWDHMAKFPAYMYGSPFTDSNFDLYYQINTGSGWSSYKNLAYKRAGAGGSAASTTITMTSTTGVNVNDYIYGVGIGGAARVQSVDNATTITATVANTGTVSGILTFNYGPNESTFPAGGVKFKVKLVTNTANTNVMYNLMIGMVSTETTRAVLYSQLTQYTLTLAGLKTGSDISIRTANVVGTSLANVDANAGTTYAYTYYYVAGTYIDIAVYKAGYKVAEVTDYLLTAANVSYPISQLIDTEYL